MSKKFINKFNLFSEASIPINYREMKSELKSKLIIRESNKIIYSEYNSIQNSSYGLYKPISKVISFDEFK